MRFERRVPPTAGRSDLGGFCVLGGLNEVDFGLREAGVFFGLAGELGVLEPNPARASAAANEFGPLFSGIGGTLEDRLLGMFTFD